MDQTGAPRLSLSRKRKKGIIDGQDTSINLDSERKFLSSSDDISVESKQNLIKDGQNDSLGTLEDEKKSAKIPESAKRVSTKETHGKISKKSIAAWLKKPCSSKPVSCPMCGKAVFLSKINQHLDSSCESDVNNRADDNLAQVKSTSNYKANRSTGSNVQKDDKDKSLQNILNDGTVKPKDCNSSVCCKPAEDENEVPLEVSSNSDHAVTPVASLGKRSERNQPMVNECNYKCVCNGITARDSPSHASCTQDVIVTRKEECSNDSGVLCANRQTHSYACTSEGLAKFSSNSIVKEEEQISAEQNSESEVQESKDYEPYYLANFKLVLTNVLSNEDDRLLFNVQDNCIIETFNRMSIEEQKLYIRLFQRKRGWFRCDKLEYPKICRNLKAIIDSLIQKGFLEDEHQLSDLRETLNLIAAPELKLLVKSLHISKSAGQKGGTKKDTIETIVSHAENQKTLFGNLKGVVLKRAKQALGSCVRLTAFPRDVFCRVLLLFTMNVIPDDEDTSNNGQAQQLSTLFLANIGKVVFPAYLIDRPTPVFHSHDSLIAFANVYQQKHEMFMALENRNFEQAYSYYPEASKKFNDILARLKDSTMLPAVLVPEHLRCFTAEWAITKMCYFGVEVFQKWRQYDDAVIQLEKLLEQDVFCFDSRGRWYDRLALNLHQHLKRPEKAMEVIRQGLSDPHVRFGRHLALVQRAKRILSSPAFQKGKKKKCEEFADLDLIEPNPSRSITISGTRCAELGVFIAPEIDQDGDVIHGTTTFCAVEEYALSYYRQQGFDKGIHGEGSTFSSLYCLFMWDIIFSSGIPDVFRSPFQAAPLDICFDSFYVNRKKVIDKRLEEITETSVKKLQEMLSKSWNDNEGQLCAGLSWERFTDIEQAKQLVGCLGGAVLSGIFARFAKGYRYHRSGLPDLVVWNSLTLDYRIAEVKGPGDKLSTKQQIWLEVLDSLGANVEVCYVTGMAY